MNDRELYGKTTESLDSLTEDTTTSSTKFAPSWPPKSPTQASNKDSPGDPPDYELEILNSKNDDKDYDQ